MIKLADLNVIDLADDGEMFTRNGAQFGICCCDCGLVHDAIARVENGEIRIIVRRNKHLTAEARESMGVVIEEGELLQDPAQGQTK